MIESLALQGGQCLTSLLPGRLANKGHEPGGPIAERASIRRV